MDVGLIDQGGQINTNAVSNSNSNAAKNNVELNNNNDQDVNNEVPLKQCEKEIKRSVDKVNKYLEGEKTHVEYEVYNKFNTVTIKFVDNDTGKVLSEVPPKKILDMIADFCQMAGIILDKKA